MLKNTGPTVEITVSQAYHASQHNIQSTTSSISFPSTTYLEHNSQNSQSSSNNESHTSLTNNLIPSVLSNRTTNKLQVTTPNQDYLKRIRFQSEDIYSQPIINEEKHLSIQNDDDNLVKFSDNFSHNVTCDDEVFVSSSKSMPDIPKVSY